MERHQTPRKKRRRVVRFESLLKGGLHLSLSRTEVDGRKIDPLRVILLSFPLGFTKGEPSSAYASLSLSLSFFLLLAFFHRTKFILYTFYDNYADSMGWVFLRARNTCTRYRRNTKRRVFHFSLSTSSYLNIPHGVPQLGIHTER